MYRWALVIFVAFMSRPLLAARPVTVDQLQQMLVMQHGKLDADLAWQLSDLRLTERLSDARLNDLQDTLPGEKSRQALAALADASAFLPPPPSEIPPNPVPNFAEQQQMMAQVVTYVTKTIQQLPNFFATRVTTHFEDTPQLQLPGGAIPYRPLHEVRTSNDTVLYREGREVVDTSASQQKSPQTGEQGLTTWGVFGPILTTVLLDAAQNELAWGHWQQGAHGPVAVFRYSVPKEKSHYQINYCCVPDRSAYDAPSVPFRTLAGYHGEITADPATGAILRLTLLADLSPTDPINLANLMVEYGPMEIGNRTYICPLKSIALSRAEMERKHAVYSVPDPSVSRPQMLLNDPDAQRSQQILLNEAAYLQYHVFRTDMRILAGNQAPPAGTRTTPGGSTTSPTESAPNSENAQAGPPATSTPVTSNAANSGPSESADASTVTGARDGSPAVAAPSPAEPEIAVSGASELPSLPTPAPPPVTETGFTLRTTTRLVDVGVVAYDKKGHPVTDLKPNDFEIYDNGQKQSIRFFSQAEPANTPSQPVASAQATEAMQPVVFTNHATAPQGTTREGTAQANSTIVLMDASSLAWGDLTYARSEILRFLKSLPADEQVGLYAIRLNRFEVLQEPTANHAEVATKLSKWIPDAQALAEAQDEERRNRQQMDFVHSIGDLAYVNGNSNRNPETFSNSGNGVTAAVQTPIDPQLQDLGNDSQQIALAKLLGVARHLAPLRGHKSLVWVASDNALADWSNPNMRTEKMRSDLRLLAIALQEALNNGHISIYPLDASQLEAGGVGADIGTRNVLAMGRSDRDAATAVMGDAASSLGPGRQTAQMQQDLHPIEGVFRELATATGGRAFRRSGDIAQELDHVVEDGRAAYQLSFSPSASADDRYHTLVVKLTGKRKITLRYRTGYMYTKEPASMKDRFREAVWQANDSNEIGLTAEPVRTSNQWVLKLKINATDLQMAQRGDRWMDKLFLFVAMRDDAVQKAQVTGKTLLMRLKPATYQKALYSGIPFEEPVNVANRSGSLRVLVVDENSGRIGTVTVPDEAFRGKS